MPASANTRRNGFKPLWILCLWDSEINHLKFKNEAHKNKRADRGLHIMVSRIHGLGWKLRIILPTESINYDWFEPKQVTMQPETNQFLCSLFRYDLVAEQRTSKTCVCYLHSNVVLHPDS